MIQVLETSKSIALSVKKLTIFKLYLHLQEPINLSFSQQSVKDFSVSSKSFFFLFGQTVSGISSNKLSCSCNLSGQLAYPTMWGNLWSNKKSSCAR